MRGAVSFLLSLWLSLFLSQSSAVKLAIQRPPRHPPESQSSLASKASTNDTLINANNQRYTANITLNGLAVTVDLDWQDTDLWVMPPVAIPSFNDTKLKLQIEYAGNGAVSGSIGVGKFALGEDTVVPRQAFLWVDTAADIQKATLANGSWGIGFGSNDPSTSRINQKVQDVYGNATWGQNALASIFALNQTASDFVGISLSRVGDEVGTAHGALTIAEYEAEYAAVANAPQLPISLLNRGFWTVQLDGLKVGGKTINWNSTVYGVPTEAEYKIVQLNLGTPNILMPAAHVAAIYSSIPSAVFWHTISVNKTQFGGQSNIWVVPCNASIDVAASFGGQDFPIHPLDVTDIQIVTSPDGKRNFTACFGTFTSTVIGVNIDALFGDVFLRNAYTVFDFATGPTNTKGSLPFVQMLSTTDVTKAESDFTSVRSALMASMPPEIAPLELVRILNGTADSSGHVLNSALHQLPLSTWWLGPLLMLAVFSLLS
ncbi:aspartic peptidase domain-containing protein [Mycena filopes]|nr:aspartic peptidase domain-containing protein [Mycena filopes]